MTSIFGFPNLSPWPVGGIFSDVMFRRFGSRGRAWIQFKVLFLEAVLLFAFGFMSDEQPAELAATRSSSSRSCATWAAAAARAT